MTALVAGIRAGLQRNGLAVCSVGKEAVPGVLSRVGEVVEQTQVRQVEGATTYLRGHHAVPLHTDHPEARIVAWWCESQAKRDGASLLADGNAVLSLMGDQIEALQQVQQRVPPQLPRQVLRTAPVWSGTRLYFAPWFPVSQATDAGRRALRTFRSLLAMGAGHKRVRLQPGDLLLVDNGRWLHGRDKLDTQNDRLLHRFWLQ